MIQSSGPLSRERLQAAQEYMWTRTCKATPLAPSALFELGLGDVGYGGAGCLVLGARGGASRYGYIT